jgi:endonuclease/exonuclease/phosphatase family metal-dependent hydrolase
MVEIINDHVKKWQKEGEELKILICGDFNDEPNTEPYTIVKDGLDLESVYYNTSVKNAEPAFTTYKYREKLTAHTIDYQFVRGFEVLCVLDMPQINDIPESANPCYNYPSDHYSLFSELKFI